MLLVARIFILLMLVGIAVQDVKSRSVYWFWFPALLIAFVGMRLWSKASVGSILLEAFLSISFILIKLLVLTLVFSFKQKKFVNITNGLLGAGDILFFFTIAFYLSVFNFIFFDVLSLLIVLLFWKIGNVMLKSRDNHIPLAGFQSLLFILILAGDWWWFHIDITSNDWLLNPLILWNPLSFY